MLVIGKIWVNAKELVKHDTMTYEMTEAVDGIKEEKKRTSLPFVGLIAGLTIFFIWFSKKQRNQNL